MARVAKQREYEPLLGTNLRFSVLYGIQRLL